MRPADLTGLVNHSQTHRPPLWTQCYQVNTVLASPSLSTMLSNKAPNLEAKMEKGISNNQKGGGGSPLAMAQVCSEKPPSEIHWSFNNPQGAWGGSPSKRVFQEMTGSEERESRFPFSKGVTKQLPLASIAPSLQLREARRCRHGHCCHKVTVTTEVGFISNPQNPKKKRQPQLPSKWEESKKKNPKEQGHKQTPSLQLLGCEGHIQAGHPGQSLSSLGLGA